MLRVALKMLLGDRAKYVGLIFGITFTSFLVTFAASYFAGIMTRGYAPIETPLSEFVKAGGSAKCLTLRLDGEEAASWKRANRE